MVTSQLDAQGDEIINWLVLWCLKRVCSPGLNWITSLSQWNRRTLVLTEDC